LLPGEKHLLANKTGPTRLGFAVLLKFFQIEGGFPQHPQDIPDVAVRHVARQVGVEESAWPRYRWQGRTIEYHRAQIRKLLDFRVATVTDSQALRAWLIEHILPHDPQPERLPHHVRERCRTLHLEPPAPERIDRLVRSALHAFEKRFCAVTYKRLSPQTRESLESLLGAGRNVAFLDEVEQEGADMLDAELVGGFVEVLGELGDGSEVSSLRVPGHVAHAHIVEHALP
jgi:uncharacterized protein DUF4158